MSHPLRSASYRRPATLTRNQIRTIYARLEEPSALPAPRESPWMLLAAFLILLAGLTLGWFLGP
jgi:hypothetical protein